MHELFDNLLNLHELDLSEGDIEMSTNDGFDANFNYSKEPHKQLEILKLDKCYEEQRIAYANLDTVDHILNGVLVRLCNLRVLRYAKFIYHSLY